MPPSIERLHFLMKSASKADFIKNIFSSPPGLGRRSRANPGSEIREPEGRSGFH
ncbi:MAG: hypothetical protein HYU36_07670 [Planctomycetes bacterium]|nr:hypothetical protein [Planctomycetota bacterium]